MTTVAIHGIAGRMGTTLVETAARQDMPTVICGIDRKTNVDMGVPVFDASEVDAALETHEPDAVIDFSVPKATTDLSRACVGADIPIVVGTTGFEVDSLSVLQEASASIPLLKATNFSRGIQGLLQALDAALAVLDEYDVEVLETHHNGKRDAPSGTAKTILDTISKHREFETVHGRNGVQPRSENEVGMLVRRAGDVRGEHDVLLAGNDEVLNITHRAEDRAVFAAGALDAATWLSGRDPGWYDFGDVVAGAE